MDKRKKRKTIRRSFTYPEIKETDYHFGSGEIEAEILRSDGDWRPYLPPAESQRRNGVESSSCFIEAQQHTLATILEEQFDIPDQNFSARFNLMFSKATPSGGDPLKAAQSFRDKGLIPDTLLPFSDQIKSWEEFNSFLGGDRDTCLAQGKAWRNAWNPHYDIVFKKDTDLDTKYTLLRQALKYSPVCISVYGISSGDSYIPKPKGVSDTHLVEAVFVDNQDCIYIWDTYPEYLKKLPPRYSPDFGMRWTIVRNTEKQQINILVKILRIIQEMLGLIEVPTPTPNTQPSPVLPPEMPSTPPKYDWDTPTLARHSVRLICDEEGLSVKDKNDLCATVACESGFNIKAKNENKNSAGKVLSTDWGIAQINSFYHIGAGKNFASVEEVLTNPEKCIRFMCKMWKSGERGKNLWICYRGGYYKKHL